MTSLAALAAQTSPWTEGELTTLRGDVRGHLLRDWGVHVVRRKGAPALARLRELTGITPELLPETPELEAWYPCRYQVQLTDTIVTEFLGGDYLRLEELLLQDATRARERLVRWVASKVGPAAVFNRASKGHPDLYTVGQVSAQVGRRDATLTWSGATLFDNPTWRILQLIGTRLMMRVMTRTLIDLQGSPPPGGGGFVMRVHWR